MSNMPGRRATLVNIAPMHWMHAKEEVTQRATAPDRCPCEVAIRETIDPSGRDEQIRKS